MSKDKADKKIANQIELLIRRLESFSTLPAVAAQLYSKLIIEKASPSVLAEIIESEPALTATIISLAKVHGLSLADTSCSIRNLIAKLPREAVRDAILSINVAADFDLDKDSVKRELIRHSLAVACCAAQIAQISPAGINTDSAYTAGLLHDIGKIALEQVMPKSFIRIADEARSDGSSSIVAERRHFGLDHAILGKRLAQTRQLPKEIILAIWLHHSDTALLARNIEAAELAQIVRAADCIARSCGIGDSGSYDRTESAEKLATSLGITAGQIEEITGGLEENVSQRFKLLGLDSATEQKTYFNTLHAAIAQLAHENQENLHTSRNLQIAAGQLDFVVDFFKEVKPFASAIETAETFALRWQKFYQTGMVCLYLAPQGRENIAEAVIVENLGQSQIVSLDIPADEQAVPEQIVRADGISNAHDNIGWLFEQIDTDFDYDQTKLVPLCYGERVIGAIAFELRYPADADLFAENFKSAASIGAAILDVAITAGEHQDMAEQLVYLLGQSGLAQAAERPPEKAEKQFDDTLLEALAEMATGAAHELNNPLSVISGRAQVLAEAEADTVKKQQIRQIQQNADQLSGIIDELMSFAVPQRPNPAGSSVKQLLDEAVELAERKHGKKDLPAQIEITPTVTTVYVDSAQIASAIANIVCNAAESYGGESGPVKLVADENESGDSVKIHVTDSGCGMDARTVDKARQPFFSAKPAGRQRGMGLAFAERLIKLNGGSLQITSQPGSGTTVTIALPKRQ